MILFALLVLLLAPWVGWGWAIAGVILAGFVIQGVMYLFLKDKID